MANITSIRDDAESRAILAEAELTDVKQKLERAERKILVAQKLDKWRGHLYYYGLSAATWIITGIGAHLGHVSVVSSIILSFGITWALYFVVLLLALVVPE